MAQETLKITITADNKQALEGLQQTSVATNQLSTNLGKLPSASNQANQALLNSGRVLQDLNYGFMGVANNLNPLLESFQRLGERSKEAGSSIGKELVSALTGPAGLGVAVSAAVFVFLKFGDEISNFITQKVGGLNNALGTEIKVFDDASKAYVKASTDINSLNEAHEQYKNGLITKESFLKQFNSTLGDTIAKTNDLSTAEKFLTENSEAYIKMIFYKAVAQEAAAQAAKKQVEQLALEELPPTPTIGQRALALVSSGGTSGADIAEKDRKAKIKDLEFDAYVLQEINKKYNVIASNIQETFTRIFGPSNKGVGDVKQSETSKILEKLAEETKSIQYQLDEGLIKKLPTSDKDKESYYTLKINAISDAVKRLAGLTSGEAKNALASLRQDLSATKVEQALGLLEKRRAGEVGANKEKSLDPERTARAMAMLDKEANAIFIKGEIDKEKEVSKALKKQQQAYENFAGTISNSVTNAFMGLFDAMERGQNVGQALEDMFKNLVKQIAAAVIQALIFKAIMNAITGGASGGAEAATGAASIADFIMAGVTPHAAGGITTGPSIGMIGEAGPEAIMPLSKLSSFLNTSFNAGSMSGSSTSNGGQFVLRGQDLLLSINRSQKASNIKGQSISLA
jgi:hypothetical protein